MYIPDKNTRYLFEGVYAVSIKDDVESTPAFFDWVFLMNPYINKVWELQNNFYVLASFSGTPPLAQALMLKLESGLGEHIHYVQSKQEATVAVHRRVL